MLTLYLALMFRAFAAMPHWSPPGDRIEPPPASIRKPAAAQIEPVFGGWLL